jgi:hypothetical protein
MFLLLAAACFLLAGTSGCATSRVITEMGVSIGGAFQKAAAKGEVSAEQSIKSWPYVKGCIKGVMAHNYEFEVPQGAKDIMKKLDGFAKKEKLTGEDKGEIIGSYVRLEGIALKQGWDRYGVNIYNLIKTAIAGG